MAAALPLTFESWYASGYPINKHMNVTMIERVSVLKKIRTNAACDRVCR